MMRYAVKFVLVVAVAMASWVVPASAEPIPMTLRTTWPCAPSTIYLDPAMPADVRAVVAEWHRAFRPDWTFTRDPGSATVQVLMQRPTLVDADGLANITADARTRISAVVEIDPNPEKQQTRIARHELGHIAGLEHVTTSQSSAMSTYPLVDRYSVLDLVGMRVAALRCR